MRGDTGAVTDTISNDFRENSGDPEFFGRFVGNGKSPLYIDEGDDIFCFLFSTVHLHCLFSFLMSFFIFIYYNF